MIRKLNKFLKNTSGNFAITTAVIALPLFTAAGLAVDYSNFINLRNSVQSSLDASGLATGAEFVQGENTDLTPDQLEEYLEAYAEDFFLANLPDGVTAEQYGFEFKRLKPNEDDEGQSIESGESDDDERRENRLRITATVNYKTYFGKLVGVKNLSDSLRSIISIGNRTVEVALVLDNSGSMGGNRIRSLREESQKLVNTIFSSAQLVDVDRPVQFSLVPFSGSVNVGAGNINSTWMDTNGWSDIHHENFDWRNTFRTNNAMTFNERTVDGSTQVIGVSETVAGATQNKTRFDVFNMLGTQWAGCVEMRPWPHNVLDTVANSDQDFNDIRDSVSHPEVGSQDGHNALFVPYFAPDEPDEEFAENDYWPSNGTPPFVDLENDVRDDNGERVRVDFDNDDDGYANNYLYDFIDYDISGNVVNFDRTVQLFTDQDTQHDTDYDYPNHAHRPAVGGQNPESAERNPQRGSNNQVNRTNWVFKYQIGEVRDDNGNNTALSNTHGPNSGCRSNPITPLTEDKLALEAAISSMSAAGTTNIQQGLTWGWRTLTPAAPFAESTREFEDDSSNLKIIILLSDGNNFYSEDNDNTPNNTAYGAWGYARSNNHPLINPVNGLATHNRWLEGLSHDDLEGTIYQNTTFDFNPDRNDDFEVIMNAHTNQACRNIHRDGISIYSIAFGVPGSGGVRDLLEACAGAGLKSDGVTPVISSRESPRFFFDVGAQNLDKAFEEIARQISNLRVSG